MTCVPHLGAPSASLSDLTTQLSVGTSASRLQSWIDIHIDARLTKSLCEFREGEIAAILSSVRQQTAAFALDSERSCERLESVVASVAAAQARQLAVVEALSQELARVRDVATAQESSTSQDRLLDKVRQLEQSIEELKTQVTSSEITQSRAAAHSELHAEILRTREEDDALIASVELLNGDLEKQRASLLNVQQWVKSFHKEVREQQQWCKSQITSYQNNFSQVRQQIQELQERLKRADQHAGTEVPSGLATSTRQSASPPQFGITAAWSELKQAVAATQTDVEIGRQAVEQFKETLHEQFQASHAELAHGLEIVARQLFEELRTEVAKHAADIAALKRQMKGTDQRLGERLAQFASALPEPRSIPYPRPRNWEHKTFSFGDSGAFVEAPIHAETESSTCSPHCVDLHALVTSRDNDETTASAYPLACVKHASHTLLKQTISEARVQCDEVQHQESLSCSEPDSLGEHSPSDALSPTDLPLCDKTEEVLFFDHHHDVGTVEQANFRTGRSMETE